MNIGFDAKRLFNNFTGLGNYSRFVVNALSEFHPDHQYLLYSPRIKKNQDTAFAFERGNIQIKQPNGIQKKLSGLWRSFSLGKVAFREDVQLFHGLSNELPLTKPIGLHTVVTIHDVIYRRFPEFYKPIDRIIYDYKFSKACEKADRIIAVSQQTARDAVEFLGAAREKISVVYQGCHPAFKFSHAMDQIAEVRKKYNLPEEFILNVGTIESRKNALIILKALLQWKEKTPLIIVGRSTPYQKELVDFIHTNRMQSRVTFIHHASFEDLPLIYRAASLFIYPSLFEGFGIPIVEAIASGLPVITSTGSCFSEAGGPDCFYVDPNNADELAVVIDRVLSNRSATLENVRKSAQYIQRFEPPVIASEMMMVYEDVINAR